MAGLFKSLVDGISHVGGLVTANISPYKVQLAKPENYDRYDLIARFYMCFNTVRQDLDEAYICIS